MKKLAPAALLVLLICATACVDVDLHLTISKDGNGHMEITAVFPEMLWFLYQYPGTPDPLSHFTARAEEHGFTVSSFRTSGRAGVSARKFLPDLAANPPPLPVQDGAVDIRRGLFKTRYILQADLNPAHLLDSLAVPEQWESYFISQVNFQFILTLPIKPDTHNAPETRDRGRTLIWPLRPGQPNKLLLQFSHWHRAGMALAGLTGVGLAAFAWLILRHSRKKRR